MGVETLSVEETAETLGCSRRQVFVLLAAGTIDRAPRFGRSVRVLRASVDRALLTPAAPTAPTRRARRPRLAKGFSVADLRADLTA